mmetsp:Transcript_61921/g.177601  ORF Transcript_61921/g.177601 Transcript_61921/m.177601 type:complete len:201 (-) Transcript_61921:162-764(-)
MHLADHGHRREAWAGRQCLNLRAHRHPTRCGDASLQADGEHVDAHRGQHQLIRREVGRFAEALGHVARVPEADDARELGAVPHRNLMLDDLPEGHLLHGVGAVFAPDAHRVEALLRRRGATFIRDPHHVLRGDEGRGKVGVVHRLALNADVAAQLREQHDLEGPRVIDHGQLLISGSERPMVLNAQNVLELQLVIYIGQE